MSSRKIKDREIFGRINHGKRWGITSGSLEEVDTKLKENL